MPSEPGLSGSAARYGPAALGQRLGERWTTPPKASIIMRR